MHLRLDDTDLHPNPWLYNNRRVIGLYYGIRLDNNSKCLRQKSRQFDTVIWTWTKLVQIIIKDVLIFQIWALIYCLGIGNENLSTLEHPVRFTWTKVVFRQPKVRELKNRVVDELEDRPNDLGLQFELCYPGYYSR